ncbi:MAG: hypothetical protein C0599_14850 [Salinivirgaceae bacterium]|nr:MAG: hypothetical protein C0599_14850 [Salinivirgaceae bacterium]
MKYLVTLIMIMFAISLYSQKQKKYSFGFEVAPNVNWAVSNTKRVENNSAQLGIKYGLRGDQFFGKNYAITSGLMISHSAINLHYDSINLKTVDNDYELLDSDVKYNFQYFELPIGMKFQSNEIGYFKILIEGGFINGFQIRSKVSSDEPDIDKEELKEGVNLYSLSYYFEGGVTYSLGAQIALKGTLFFSSGINDITSDDNSEGDRITQNSVGMKIGLVF